MNRCLKLIASTCLLFSGLSMKAESLPIGSSAPEALSALNHKGATIDLSAAFKQGTTLVFFYPKANTPGCTAQACSLRDQYESFSELGIKVFGISYDGMESQARFAEQQKLPYDLICDENKAVSKAFGRPLFSRQAYLIHEGKIVWNDLNASTSHQAEDVRKAMETLGLP
jgi:peroxiredoxin Q/BCP